jgi:hypothetical protein
MAIAESLTLHGYQVAEDVPIWQVHLQGELRRINGEGSRCQRMSPF